MKTNLNFEALEAALRKEGYEITELSVRGSEVKLTLFELAVVESEEGQSYFIEWARQLGREQARRLVTQAFDLQETPR